MKKVFADTNILIDLLAHREPFFDEAKSLFSLAESRKIELMMSALTLANTNYILSKQLSISKIKLTFENLRKITTILPLDDKVITKALSDNNFDDFEDCLQYCTAVAHNCNVIVTRNIKDYKNSQIEVMSAKTFLDQYGCKFL